MQEDRELLSKNEHTLTTNEKHCLLYRMGEKEIYEFMIDTAKVMIDVFGLEKFKIFNVENV